MITISINPIAFTIGNISIRWYGIMVALAVVELILWMVWRIRRGANISFDNVVTVALIAIPSGIIISRLLHIIDLWSFYMANPRLLLDFEGNAAWVYEDIVTITGNINQLPVLLVDLLSR